MTNYYDPFDPRRRPPAPGGATGRGGQRPPTLEDYQQLVAAYRETQAKLQESDARYQKLVQQAESLQRQFAEQTKQARALEQELSIKNDALHQQGEALKETESELVWERAARQKLETEQQANEEQSWQEKFARLQADMENMRKRLELRKDQEVAGERNRILLDMLPLADHLDLALQHAGSLEEQTTIEFVKNIEATRHAFLETLKRYGIERITAQGEPFDPTVHEAVGHSPSPDVPADHVAQVLQSGYRDRERIIRPARVLVSSGAGG